MLQSLVILESRSVRKSGNQGKFISCLECLYAGDDGKVAFDAHPVQIFLFGLWYGKTGWDSDRKVIHYRTG